MQELPYTQVLINDPYWSPRQEINARRAIFHQWEMLEASRCIDNFRLTAGEKAGFREGWFFADSDAYKWLEAACRILPLWPSERLEKLVGDFIELILRAQQPDGYLFTYNQLHFPGKRWINLQVEHELYCLGHLIEAGVSHFQATSEQSLLEVAERAADLLVREFLDAGSERTCGHEEIEIALLRLGLATGKDEYCELARRMVERRGRISLFPLRMLTEFRDHNRRERRVAELRQVYRQEHQQEESFQLPPGNQAKQPRGTILRWYWSALTGQYNQQHAPVRRQTTPVGHSVRFGYLSTAAAMLCRLQPDESLRPALVKSWERMVERRMYVTGGLGALPGLEGFGKDYELDPEFAYAETCAALASLFWNWEMACLTKQAPYSDLFEWQLYNAAAVGMGLEGDTYLYNNPLSCRGEVERRPWYAVPCCPSNLSRTWAALGKYVYTWERDELWVHQYIGSETKLPNGLLISMESCLPLEGKVSLKLAVDPPRDFTLHLRQPSWCGGRIRISQNGEIIHAQGEASTVHRLPDTAQGVDPRDGRWLSLRQVWRAGDELKIELSMPISLRRAHPRVRGYGGKAALTRGPLVYCLESVDNPGVDLFSVQLDPASLRADFAPDLLGGTILLRCTSTQGQTLTFIPYHLWGNRGPSQMVVWVRIASSF